MDELQSILEQMIAFSEKYDAFHSSLEPKETNEFWSQEEMSTGFTYENHTYVVEQIWSRNIFHAHYYYTIYEDGKESSKDMDFIRSLALS